MYSKIKLKSQSYFLPITLVLIYILLVVNVVAQERPNIILIMTDDQGWGQTGYYNHPILKTPNLDKMAENGLRFDRFYAGAPVCSPTRASVLTGRACHRTGVFQHGYPLRKQEKVLPRVLKDLGYATAHFGKWHLNGLRGPGAPVFGDDTHSPGEFGFQYWLTVSNFFDINPIMSRNGKFEEFEGTSSEIIVGEALNFIEHAVEKEQPFFTVIWDGSPHDPMVSTEEDMKGFENLNIKSKHHYGELVAFDRSLGKLRKRLRELQVEKNTILWFCSDNGGLPKIEPETVGGLRGNKGTIWEGGLRVPGIIEWEGHIKTRITNYPASTMDIFPTITDLLDLPADVLLEPVDGISIKPLIQNKKIKTRKKPIPFRYQGKGALVDNEFKLVATNIEEGTFELYNLQIDKTESTDISVEHPKKFQQLKADFIKWNATVEKSIAGLDYPEKEVDKNEPERHFWMDDPKYADFKKKYGNRPEYSGEYRKMNQQNKK